MDKIKAFIARLTSRKFMLAVAAFSASFSLFMTGLANNDSQAVGEGLKGMLATFGGYALVEGLIDFITAWRSLELKRSKVNSGWSPAEVDPPSQSPQAPTSTGFVAGG